MREDSCRCPVIGWTYGCAERSELEKEMWMASACHRAPLGRKGRGQSTESRIIPASDGHRRKSQVMREPKMKDQNQKDM